MLSIFINLSFTFILVALRNLILIENKNIYPSFAISRTTLLNVYYN